MIDRIRRRAARARSPFLARGIGDDCAVLSPPRGHELLVTTDFCLEDVHFRRAWHPAKAVGHRCLVRGLSDIAAMGGTPIAAFLSLALPANLPQRWVDDFFTGLLALADHWRTPLAGGDIAQSPQGVMADILVLGSVPEGKAILRSTARPGDLMYVTGILGLSSGALEDFRRGKKPTPRTAPRHFFPEPRIDIGQYLRDHKLASAMIDLSDGLSTDLSHICDESSVGAVVYGESVPHQYSLDLALHGGEDYELLFTAPSRARMPKQISGVSITPIGEIIARRGMWLTDATGRRTTLKPRGWEHFREPGK
ncbi:MAG TPA: thiamine-phosphate kinase [Candidatus Koribacter sp.]|jgi:thiamine-monophosphate kinase